MSHTPPPVTAPRSIDSDATQSAVRGLARGGSFAAVGSGLGAALGLVLTLVVTHGLSQTTAGQFFSSTAVFLLLQTLLAFGVGAGLVRFVPRMRALNRSADIPVLIKAAFAPVVIAGAIGAVALWLCAEPLASAVGGGDGLPLVATFRVIAALFLPATLEVAAVEATRAFGSIRSYVLLQQIGVPLLRPLLVGLGLVLDMPLWVLAALWLVPLVIALGLSCAIARTALRAMLGPDWYHLRPISSTRAILREYWAFTAARGTAMVMDTILTWLDVVLVASMVSPSQAAIYAAASRFITAGTIVLQALRLALATDISAALARRDHSKVSELYRTATQWVVVSSWPLYLTVAIFGSTILNVFGPDYSEGAGAVTILSIAMMINLGAGNVGTVLLMGGKSWWVLTDKTVCVVVNVGLNLSLIPHFGIKGAAVAWAATILIDGGLAFTQVRRGMGIGGDLSGVALAAVLAVVCFGAPGLVLTSMFGTSLTTLIGAVSVACVLYVVPLFRWRRALGLDVLFSSLRS